MGSTPESIKNGIIGAVLGEAIGDSLGHPIEFKKTHKVVDLELDNKFTDDTQMFCAIGEALLEAPPHLNEENFMTAVARRFVDWRHNPLGGSHRAPGGTCMEAVRKMGAKVNWKESSFTDSKGNGSVMRSGVVGTMYWNDPEYAFRIGCLTSVPTHNNLEAILGSGVAAFLVAAAIKAERTFNEVITDVLFLCSDFMNPYVVPMYPHKVKLGTTYQEQNPWYAISRIAAAYVMGIGQVPPEEMIKRIGNHVTLGMGHVLWDGAVIPALAEAIFFNARYNSFNKIVLETVNNTDDCDTVGAIAGTIAGARVGVLGIQKDWRQRIEMSDYLHNIANRLWDASLNVVVTKIEPEKSMEDTVDVDALLEGDDDITF